MQQKTANRSLVAFSQDDQMNKLIYSQFLDQFLETIVL